MLYFDYSRQTWIRDGIVQRCGHREAMRCTCYGRRHAGELIDDRVALENRPSVNHTREERPSERKLTGARFARRWPGFGEDWR